MNVAAPPLLARSSSGTLTATGQLVRFLLRRDRLRLALWTIGLVGLMAASASQLPALYDEPDSIQGYVDSVGGNPALVVFAGPGYGFEDPTIGAILVNETSLWMALACGLMGVFAINRYTRLEEDAERADLVLSGIVGRHAPMAAALIVAVAANVVVVIGSIICCVAVGFDVVGSVALCASFGLVGVAFAAVGLVTAQLAPGSRTNLGLASAIMGASFLLRGIGDVAAPALSWLSPFGWGIGIRAFADERWWTLAGLVLFALAVTALAFTLFDRRDLGSGFFTTRAGDHSAPEWMRRPLGLTVRLQRGAILGWAIGLFLIGALYGSIADEIESLLEDNPELGEFLAAVGGMSLTDAYLSTSTGMLGMLTAGFAVSSVLRLRSGEQQGWAEFALAGSVSRWEWASVHGLVSFVGSLILLVVAGAGVGVGYALVISDWSQVPRLIGAQLVALPAVAVLIGLALALFGWARWAVVAAWVVFAAVVAVGIFGEILGLPEWVTGLSPFERLPAAPGEEMEWRPVTTLSVVAVVLAVLGAVGFRRRDLDTE